MQLGNMAFNSKAACFAFLALMRIADRLGSRFPNVPATHEVFAYEKLLVLYRAIMCSFCPVSIR